MKKIDLHIHTVVTMSDSHFSFSLETFKRYVVNAKLDAVAVTNHDRFDLTQFEQIHDGLGIVVFPGIEINVESGHVLVISTFEERVNFESKTKKIEARIQKIGDTLLVEDLIEIFGDLHQYLIIPHYDKGPPIAGETLRKLMPFISAGEVASAKKFVRASKDPSRLTPVLFSDSRMMENLLAFPSRQTFIDCGEITLSALKACLKDKSKVSLSEKDGNKLWQGFEGRQMLSTGLNVVLGARSSGKTHTLDLLVNANENVKYIEQFALVQQSDAKHDQEFNSHVERERSLFTEKYLAGLKKVSDEILNINLEANQRSIVEYLETLIASAVNADLADAYSNAALFNEVEFAVETDKTLGDLISSVQQLIANGEFRVIILKHLDMDSLRALICELIETARRRSLDDGKKKLVNSFIKDVKLDLKFKTSATQVKDVDLYGIAMDQKKVKRFEEIVYLIREEGTIYNEPVQGFSIEAKKRPFRTATEVQKELGKKISFAEAFKQYKSPYAFLQALKDIDSLARADIYKLFAKIEYGILNRDGYLVSGGERSEFRLLQQIKDAQNYDLLLIDEPESSFDNLFLKTDVNQILKDISLQMPVVVVTHNSTVGASIGADFVLYTVKDYVDDEPVYRIYSGYPSDKELVSHDGKRISNYEILMNSLEAGVETYNLRGKGYEAVKN